LPVISATSRRQDRDRATGRSADSYDPQRHRSWNRKAGEAARGRIVIEVADDGAGIDRARVKSIAANKGLIAPDAVLSEDEIDNLIFLPGFSTAETVSDISGRGVGMDVVKRSIQALRRGPHC